MSGTYQRTHVRLKPLAPRHAEDLFEVGKDETIWPYMPSLALKSIEDTQALIDQALEIAGGGTQIPFAIIEPRSAKAIGSTRYLDIRRNDRGLEIGWSWIGTAYQRTVVNTEGKYLLLRYAFEKLRTARVQLKTDLARGQAPARRPDGAAVSLSSREPGGLSCNRFFIRGILGGF